MGDRREQGSCTPKRVQTLFGAEGQDLVVVDLDFDAEGRANVAALHDGATDPDIAGKASRF